MTIFNRFLYVYQRHPHADERALQQGPAPERPSWVLLLHPGAGGNHRPSVGSFHHGPMGILNGWMVYPLVMSK